MTPETDVQSFEFQVQENEKLTLQNAVFQALGAASVCWETPEGAGVFQSDRAKAIGDALVEFIRSQASAPSRDDCTPHVQQGPGPSLHIEGDTAPVIDLHTTDLDTALHSAIAADRLSLGWSLAGYDCPDDWDSVHEFRLVAWRQLTSEIGPLSGKNINLNVKHDDEPTGDVSS